MTRARLIVALPALAAVTLGLTACDKPTPGASVFSGTTSTYRHAACWAPEGSSLSADSCSADLIAPPESASIDVVPGQTIGISVDPAIADIGWYPVLGSTRLTDTPITGTYWRFTPTQAQASAVSTLSVLAGNADGTRGIWTYRLVPAT